MARCILPQLSKKRRVNLCHLIDNHLKDVDTALNFCVLRNLLKTTRKCSKCNRLLKWITDSDKDNKDGKVFLCPAPCKFKESVRIGTFFENSHLPVQKILLIIYLWTRKYPEEYVQFEAQIPNEAVVNWLNFIRQLCGEALAKNKENWILGGRGKMVEIDESQFGRKKGQDEIWFIGGVEKGTKPLKCFITAVRDRSAETLMTVIKRFVAPETVIITDCWEGYNTLEELSEKYLHAKMDRSKNFACTNQVMNLFKIVQNILPNFGLSIKLYNIYFEEFIWRKLQEREDRDPFDSILADIAQIYQGSD